MSESSLSNMLEAVLLASGRPVSVEQMRELFEEQERPSEADVAAALAELAERFADRACELREVGSGWRIQVRPQYAELVSRLWQERPSRYSRALLETLALIAYRQPITRGEIEGIRGVAVSSTIMRTMHERNWVRVVGHREVPGRPELLGTTREFLDYFGLKSLDDLPTLAELRDLDDIKVQLEFPGGDSDGSRPALPGGDDALEGEVVAREGATEETGSDDDEPQYPRDAAAPTMVASRDDRGD